METKRVKGSLTSVYVIGLEAHKGLLVLPSSAFLFLDAIGQAQSKHDTNDLEWK